MEVISTSHIVLNNLDKFRETYPSTRNSAIRNILPYISICICVGEFHSLAELPKQQIDTN